MSGPVAAQATRPDAGLTTRAAAESAPLELIALTHEREGDGIIVRGVVRNPSTGIDRGRGGRRRLRVHPRRRVSGQRPV